MTPKTPEQIAGRLTKAQVAAVKRGNITHGRGCWPLLNSMRAKGLAANFYGGLTPLGLQVRAILRGEEP